MRAARSGRFLLVAMILLAAIAVFNLVPAKFQIVAQGELQPASRREVFAPFDGEIVALEVRHDQNVNQNDLLAVLQSREIEQELEKLQGELNTTEKKLLAVEAARVQDHDTIDRTLERHTGRAPNRGRGRVAAAPQKPAGVDPIGARPVGPKTKVTSPISRTDLDLEFRTAARESPRTGRAKF